MPQGGVGLLSPVPSCPLSGLGYIVGSQVGSLAGDWHWALRVSRRSRDPVAASRRDGAPPSVQVTPGLGLVAVLLLLFVVQEPKRGAVERPEQPVRQTSWLTDLLALSRK